MTIYLARHAKAGSRAGWEGDDHIRPLSKSGRRQAIELARRIAPIQPSAVLSSPYLRCVQTLEPLAEACELAIQIEQRLCEGTSFVDTLELLAEVADRTVLCSHGDVIPDTIEALVRRGLSVRGEADWRKASVWVIERDVSGCFTDAIAWPPPAIELP